MAKDGMQPDTKPKMQNYSLGMKQKLAIAQAIMKSQDILLLDEPFNALDIDSVEKMRELLSSLKKEEKTIVFTSHNREYIDLLSDHIFRVRNYGLEKLK